MDGFEGGLKGSLRLRLATWLSVAVSAVAIAAGAFSFASAFDEAIELQDDILRQVAAMAAHGTAPVANRPGADLGSGEIDPETHLVVQSLSRAGAAGPLALPPTLRDGMQTVGVDGDDYRVVVRTLPDGERIAVAQETRMRDEIARDGAVRTMLPLLVLLPVLVLVVVEFVRRMLDPVGRLSREVERRTEQELHPLVAHDLPSEIRPFVTAINRLLGRVDQAMGVQRRFVADAAHELRSPMTAISLQAERLAASSMSDEARTRLAAVREGIERARKLLDQLLGLARAQTRAEAAATTMSLRSIVARVLEDMMPLADAKRIDVGMADDRDSWIRGHEIDLVAIARNLVDNAIRYTPDGGRVDLRMSETADEAVLEIEDSGPGVPAAERARVLEAFYRVPGTGQVGSGLGLSIVRAVAERMGGRVELSDANLGTGLKVRVVLPKGGGDSPGNSPARS